MSEIVLETWVLIIVDSHLVRGIFENKYKRLMLVRKVSFE